MKSVSIYILSLFVLLISCQEHKPGQVPVTEDYADQIEEWKQSRIESLTEPTGWLRLAGMFWLDEGENTFGSSSENDIQFPEGTIPNRAGTFTLNSDGTVMMSVDEGVSITYEDEQVPSLLIYDGEESLHVEHGSLEWLVIVRGDITAIRLFNKENEKADEFTGFPAYEVNPEWNREAKFIPNPEGTTISIINVLSQQEDVISPGVVEFTLNGSLYTLDALEGSERMFIMLGDLTNRNETYQAGRYIYIDYPEEGSDYTEIDFNKAYNLPCAYNLFTTCQLPPMQNRLDIAITAGEKRPVEWQGL